jgi:hypothetical protein
MNLTARVIDGGKLDTHLAALPCGWTDPWERCIADCPLPLDIANPYDWEAPCRQGFAAKWTGDCQLGASSFHRDPGQIAPSVGRFEYGMVSLLVCRSLHIERYFNLMIQRRHAYRAFASRQSWC